MKVKLIALAHDGKAYFEGWVESPTAYVGFYTRGDRVVLDEPVPKGQYKNAEHFAAVMGKFNPHMPFLPSAIPMENLSYRGLVEVWPQVKKSLD